MPKKKSSEPKVMTKCDLCQREYDREAIIPIPIYVGGEITTVTSIAMPDRAPLNLCQSCLACMVWVESRDESTNVQLYVERPPKPEENEEDKDTI